MRFLFLSLFVLGLAGCDFLDLSNDGEDDQSDTAEDTGDSSIPDLPPVYCFDGDGDGWASDSCVEDAGSNSSYIEVADQANYEFDCNDADGSVYPGQYEDEDDDIDNDCDGQVDEEPTVTRWVDADLDTYGNPDMPVSVYEDDIPEYLVANSSDCDDSDAQITTGETYVVDEDGDGYGDENLSSILTACTQPDGYVDNTEDCNDESDDWFPGAEEDCELDEDRNCDGVSPFVDQDNDEFAACEDCNDQDENINPDAEEVCDSIDNDCDSRIDDNDSDVSDAATWYDDNDSDGWGDAGDTQAACIQPSGTVENDEDCDDAAASVNPDADEVCDEVDNDCDSLIDDADADVEDQVTWLYDGDGDGYGDLDDSAISCAQPVGDSRGEYVSSEVGADCDDDDNDVYPGAGCE